MQTDLLVGVSGDLFSIHFLLPSILPSVTMPFSIALN